MLDNNLYKISEIEIARGIDVLTFLDKNDSPREMHKCIIRVQVNLEGKIVYHEQELQFVIKEEMCSFDDIKETVRELINKLALEVKAIDSGVNLLPGYKINEEDFSDEDIWVRKDLLRALENLSWYKINAKLINIYTELINYKGDDQLQQKKWKKMIDQAEFIEQVGKYGTNL